MSEHSRVVINSIASIAELLIQLFLQLARANILFLLQKIAKFVTPIENPNLSN
jgi:hypothetical protein